jgi:CRISPR/Cas system-associated exonuclease Cas4 (RecB family)
MDESRRKLLEMLREIRNAMPELLRLEKRRRGVPEDKLLFVGVSGLAEFWWCARKSLLEVRNSELKFFASYLFEGARMMTPDFSDWAAVFTIWGLIRMGESLKLLEIIDGLYKKNDPDEVLKRAARMGETSAEVYPEVYPAVKIGDRILTTVRRGDRLLVIHREAAECDLVRGEHGDTCREVLGAACAGPERVGWELGDLDRRLARGKLLEEILAERHPTILWAREWDRYVVVGIPDGVGGNFVYEFKSTKIRRLEKYILPVARAQANIYAWLFDKKRWVVEIFSCADLKLYRWEGEADYADTERTLEGFRAIEEGREIMPPACWKCERCKYRDSCGLRDRCR